MQDFYLQLVLFISLGTVIYVAARAVPRISEGESERKPARNFLTSLPLHKFDAAAASFLEKLLRKVKVLLLRVDNGVNGYLSKIRSSNGNGNGVNGQKSLFTKDEEPTDGANS